jgi:hypothetical protein
MVEHPPELEVGDRLLEAVDVAGDREQRRVVVLGARQLEELRAVGEAVVERRQRADDRVERLLLLAELLRALRVVPDLRVLELARYRREPRGLLVDVKDTSASRPPAPSARRACSRSG